MLVEYKELADTIRFYHRTISQYITYYNKLPGASKLQFLKRVHYFNQEPMTDRKIISTA